MKTGEASYRQSRAPKIAHPVLQQSEEAAPDLRKSAAPSQRAQRRQRASEERRQKRKARRRSSRDESPKT